MHSTNIAPVATQTIRSTTKHGCMCSACSTVPSEFNELIRLTTLLQIIGISRPQVYVLMKEGRFPKPVKLGRSTAWVRKEINDWVQQRIADRDAALAG